MTDQDTTCTMCNRVISEDEWPICTYCDADVEAAMDEILDSDLDECFEE